MTDHTCNGGCQRCVPELDISYWMHKHMVASEQAETYRQILTNIVAHFPDTPAMQWLGNPYIETHSTPAPHFLLRSLQQARTLIHDDIA